MTSIVRHLPLIVAGLLIVIHPLNAELIKATPGVFLVEVLVAAGGIAVLCSRSRTTLLAGTALLVLGAAVSPLVAWAGFLIPLCRCDLGWKRLLFGFPVVIVAALSAFLFADLGPGLAELTGSPVGKALEAAGLLQAATVSAVLPFATPHLGTTRYAFPLIGAVLVGLAVPFLLQRAFGGVSRRWQAFAVIGSVGVLAPILPALFGLPHLSTTALLVSTLTIAFCEAAGWILARMAGSPLRNGVIALSVLSLVAVGGRLTERRRSSAFDTWSDEGAAWSALLAADPISPYRWDYSEWLREQGDHAGARREAIRYLKLKDAPASRKLDFALVLLADGEEDAAFDLLKRLDGSAYPTREPDLRAVLSLYEARSAWELYFRSADAALGDFADLRLDVAKTARRLERTDTFRKHMAVLMAAERPSVAAFEANYRDLAVQQDIQGLTAIGGRAIGLYADAYVGYAARGKAAKIVRHDDEMIRFHEQALERDPTQIDLHWDLAIVYHGQSGSASLAAEHYEKVLVALPAGSRRDAVLGWIASLRGSAISLSNDLARGDVAAKPTLLTAAEGIFGQLQNLTQPMPGPCGTQTVDDPVYPATGDVRIQKPDLSVPSVGFPFTFARCYRSGAIYDGPLGKCWDFNFNMHMVLEPGAGHMTSYDGTNRSDTYTYSSSPSAHYDPPAGRFDTIKLDATTSQWWRTDLDGFKYVYEKTSVNDHKIRLKEWRDLNGNVMSFSYDSTSDTGRLTTVTDTTGRAYTFAYDSNNRITLLSDFGSTPRKIRYVYGTDGTLVSVTELDGESTLARETTYKYQTLSGLSGRYFVQTITDGKENAGTAKPFVRNYYNASGTVVVQEYGTGADTEDSPVPTSAAFILSRNTTTKIATSTDREGTAISFFYDDNNLITKKEWLHGTTHPITLFTYNGQYEITRITKNDGARIDYAYDTSGNVTSAKTSDSAGAYALESAFTYGTYNRLSTSTNPSGVIDAMTYDANGNLTSITHDTGGLSLVTTYHYDSGNKYLLDYTDDSKSIRTTFSYDGSYRLSGVTRDPSGLNIAIGYSYDEFGNMTQTSDGLSNTTTYTVNRLNQVTEVDAPSPLGYFTKFFYDASDNLTQTKVQNGSGQGSGDFVVDMEYDLLDNLTKKTSDIDGSSRAITEYHYDKDDKLTRVTTPQGTEVVWAYNDLDLNTSVTLGSGATEAATYSYTYDDNFRLTKIEEPNGPTYKTEYEYDHHDRATKVKNAAGNYVKSVFSNQLLTARETYTSGGTLLAKTTSTYDHGDRLTTTEVMAKDHTGASLGLGVGDGWVTSTLVYDANGNVLTTKDEANNETHFTYDNANRLSIVEDAAGSKVTYVYDRNSNVLTKTNDEKQIGVSGFDTFVYKFGYDNLNRLTKTYDPANNANTFTYDARNVVTTEDPNGSKRFMHYDELNRTIQLDVEYSGTSVLTTKWEYDKNSRLTKLIDAKNHNTTYAYDALDRVVTETYPDSGTRTFTYDGNSNITQAVDPNSTHITYTYNTRNLMTNKAVSFTGSHVSGESTGADFAYDEMNRLTYAGDTDSKVYYVYNTLGLVESEEERYAPASLSTTGKVVTYDYNSQGLLLDCFYPGATSSSGELIYTYDVLNRLSTMSRKTGSSTSDMLSKWTFKGPSRVIKKEYANGTWADIAYDTRGNVASIVHQKPDGPDHNDDPDKILECTYAYDDAGKVKSEALIHYKNDATVREDKGFTYLYDKAYRLTKLYRGAPASQVGSNPPSTYTKKLEYSFDANSNRTTVVTTPSGGSASNDYYTTNTTNAYTAVNWAGTTVNFSYDTAGNRTYSNEEGKDWYYDYQNHLVEIHVDSDNYVQYRYDALGRRFGKDYDYTDDRYESRKRLYYAGAELIQEYDINHWDTWHLEVEYTSGRCPLEPISIRTYSLTTGSFDKEGFYHQDAYGSVYAITKQNGSSAATIIENYRYTEYGEVTVNGGDTTTAAAPFGNKWAWHCHYYDFEVTNVASGVALFGDRSTGYDPEIGGMISRGGGGGGTSATCPSPSDGGGSGGGPEFAGADLGSFGLTSQYEQPGIATGERMGGKGYHGYDYWTIESKCEWRHRPNWQWRDALPSKSEGQWVDFGVSEKVRFQRWVHHTDQETSWGDWTEGLVGYSVGGGGGAQDDRSRLPPQPQGGLQISAAPMSAAEVASQATLMEAMQSAEISAAGCGVSIDDVLSARGALGVFGFDAMLSGCDRILYDLDCIVAGEEGAGTFARLSLKPYYRSPASPIINAINEALRPVEGEVFDAIRRAERIRTGRPTIGLPSNVGSSAANLTKWAKPLAALGTVVVVVSVGASVTAVINSNDKPRTIAEEAGGWAGAWVGAKLVGTGGAIVGSAFPGIGTTIGGIVGGVGGGIAGWFGGKKAAGAVVDWVRSMVGSPAGSEDR